MNRNIDPPSPGHCREHPLKTYLLSLMLAAATPLIATRISGTTGSPTALTPTSRSNTFARPAPTAAATASPQNPVATPQSVLYAMNYLSPETTTDDTLKDLKNSGFDTLIIFSIDGNAAGDLTFFGTPIYHQGAYVGPAGWPARIHSLKTGTTSIRRLQFCLAGPYGVYRTCMNTHGTGLDTNWHKNWARLKVDMGVDAIDFNDENTWDAASLVQLGEMMAAIGYKVSLCPYNHPAVWQRVQAQLGSKVDSINLQCYDGGRYNNVGTWNSYFGGLKVTPLFWTLHADGTGDSFRSAQAKVAGWNASSGINSAGAWQYSDMRDYSGGTAAEFDAAIRAGLQ
jgi:hypothetical protein